METGVIVFAAFGLTSQVVLAAFFAARRWAHAHALRFGSAAYGLGAVGFLVGLWLALDGASPRLVAGPILLAGWAVLGAAFDLWRPRPWRAPPVEWRVLGPYVALYFLAQMFLWWPLWDLARGAWAAFGVLFAISTALNLQGHRLRGSTADRG